jgi:LPS sulfotransferase NodH
MVTVPANTVEPVGSYFVCGTPRTGTSLLLGLLESTGIAGHPQAYFRAPDESLWAERWRIPRTRGGGFDYGDYVRAALAHGRTSNSVFGAKLMWGTLEEMIDKLRTVTPEPPGEDVDLLIRTFGRPRFVHVRRDDVLAQAVSWLRAEQTDTWYVGGNGEIGSTSGTGQAPSYDRRRISDLMQVIDEHNAAWDSWFASVAVLPYRVRYEDLAADTTAVTRGILDFLGLQLLDGHPIVPRHHRQADELNDQWAARYRAHLPEPTWNPNQ